jgi:hypothetical protein
MRVAGRLNVKSDAEAMDNLVRVLDEEFSTWPDDTRHAEWLAARSARKHFDIDKIVNEVLNKAQARRSLRSRFSSRLKGACRAALVWRLPRIIILRSPSWDWSFGVAALACLVLSGLSGFVGFYSSQFLRPVNKILMAKSAPPDLRVMTYFFGTESADLTVDMALLLSRLENTQRPRFSGAARTWISSFGNDANPCSETEPCRTFANAILKTRTEGKVNCLGGDGLSETSFKNAITFDCGEVVASIRNPFEVKHSPKKHGKTTIVLELTEPGSYGASNKAFAVHPMLKRIEKFRRDGRAEEIGDGSP